MRIPVLFLLALILPLAAYSQSQKGRTFQIEKLTPPNNLLELTPADVIWKNLVYNETDMYKRGIRRDSAEAFYGIVKSSTTEDGLVYLGANPFIASMHSAYADHRPFVMSPDMIWLLISQGFSHHVNNNAEALRHHFVDFDGNISLIVNGEKVRNYNDPNAPWEELVGDFAGKIAKNTKGELANLLTANFSTTTPVELVASQITMMNTVKPYFEFIAIFIGCGIPEITLLGTPEDWQKVLDKTRALAKYDLEWWTVELEPILREFVNASKGRVNKSFWINMFKIHKPKQYGARDRVDGWIVKFFPYGKAGRRKLVSFELFNMQSFLPPEFVRVDMKIVEASTGTVIPMELWAGFIGAVQNPDNFALTPRIGWMVRHKTDTTEANSWILNDLKKKNTPVERPKPKPKPTPTADTAANGNGMAVAKVNMADLEGIPTKSAAAVFGSGIDIRVKELPAELYELGTVYRLSVRFTGKISVPDKLAESEIYYMTLTGDIDEAGIERICKLFPRTALTINGTRYNWP